MVSPQDTSVTPNELHVQVDAPFVFHAAGPPPAPAAEVAALGLDPRSGATPRLADPIPVSETETAKRSPARNFFKKIGGFFAALFR